MTTPAELNSLLRWSIENTVPSDGSAPSTSSAPRAALHPNDGLITDYPETDAQVEATKRSDLNSAMLDHIMGKSDATVMREQLNFATNKENPVEDRVGALDQFEMLIESIDNANNIGNMNLWPQLLDLVNDKEDEIIRMAVWISGTAIQNNPKAQEVYFAQNPLPAVYSIISGVHPTDSSHRISAATRSKAVYCLSAAVKHWPQAIDVLSADSARGWTVIREGVSDPDVTIRRKVAFLANTLLIQSDEIENQKEAMVKTMQEQGITAALVKSLVSPLPTGEDGQDDGVDADYQEKALRALVSAAERDGLSGEDKQRLTTLVGGWQASQWEEVGFSASEGKEAAGLFQK